MSQITFVLLLLWTSGTSLASTVHLHSPEDVITVHNGTTGRSCGVPAIKPNVPRCPSDGLGIIKGEEAVPHSWPWQISLQYSSGSPKCGGSLINQDWVVTAAHCKIRQCCSPYEAHNSILRKSLTISKSNRLILGQHNLKNNNNIQNMRIGKVFNHPNYNPQTHDYDIALIKLQRPAQLDKNVSPVCVAETRDNSDFYAGTKCVATGWGLTQYEPPRSPDNLQQVCLSTTSYRMCQSKYWGKITNRMFCAGAGGADTCQGDSGGPLVCMKNGAWTLFGITSWGAAGCDSNYKPGVYTRIPNVRAWMDRTMANN